MSSAEESKEQIERFQSLTNLDQEELESLFNEKMVKWFADFIGSQIIGIDVPSLASAKEFSNAMYGLRTNKQVWSQHFSSIVLDLYGNKSESPGENTSEKLEKFIQECPWAFLRRSAESKRPVVPSADKPSESKAPDG